jgi:hypothetical protein
MSEHEQRVRDKGAAEREEARRHGGEQAQDGHAGAREAHHALNEPAREPSPDEWPDPYDRRPDPRGPYAEGHEPSAPDTGAVSTSEPHPREDPEAIPAEPPKREKLDR